MVLADVLKRWQVLQGKQAILCTGTDEHGMKVRQLMQITMKYLSNYVKIQRAAQKAGQDVRAFCDQNYKSFEVKFSAKSIASLVLTYCRY